MRAKFLSAREARPIFEQISEQWDVDARELFSSYALIRTGKDRLYIITRDVATLKLELLRIDSLGLYVANVKGKVRLTLEGSQLVGPHAQKNVVLVDDQELRAWFRGEHLEKTGEWNGFVIIKHGTDYIGCGRYTEGKIQNFLPKARWVKALM